MTDKDRLIQLLQERSVRFGTFSLASGGKSDFYVDARQTTLHGEGAFLVGRLVVARLAPSIKGVGGMTLGADPIAVAASVVAFTQGRVLHSFLVRKEAKSHGTGQAVEGLSNLAAGSEVAVVEDTTTTGGSLLRAVERVRDVGLVVARCITVVDREEGAADALAAAGLTLEVLVTRSELGRAW